MTDVFLDDKFTGTISNPKDFLKQIKDIRRKGDISNQTNARYIEESDNLLIETNRGRLRRPLIIVKDGKPLLTENHIKQLKKKEISWGDLVKQGIIEYLDALEEEDAYVAVEENELTKEHTHLEISPLAIYGLVTTLIPYANHTAPGRVSVGSKNQKQSVGIYSSNFLQRMDMDVNILYNPQKPIVRTIMEDEAKVSQNPHGQNLVIAVMCYGGYNMEDAIILNEGSIERGMGRSSYFRPISTEELRYSGGQSDEIQIPDKDVKNYRMEENYRYLEEDGIIYPGATVKEGDVIIGKTSPPRFMNTEAEYNLATSIRRESSQALKHGEEGVIDFVLLTKTSEGNKLVQVRMRVERKPEIGDKFISRHGQKGVIGMVLPPADMPFTASGITPDLIFSPNGIPSRMSMSHILEIIGAKVGALKGKDIDGTTFNAEPEEELRKQLLELGFRDDGTETMYNGKTGEMIKAKIYVGNMYYLKLKHQVANHIHARARGPVQLLTRQPTEGRAKEGGLRLGEMEKDTFVAHGASLLLKERFDSDKTILPVCEKCGSIAIYDYRKNRAYCPVCGDKTEITNIEMSYAFKLFMDEIKSLGIYPKLQLTNILKEVIESRKEIENKKNKDKKDSKNKDKNKEN